MERLLVVYEALRAGDGLAWTLLALAIVSGLLLACSGGRRAP